MLNVNVKTCQMLIDEFVIFCYLRGPFGASFYEITLLKDKKKVAYGKYETACLLRNITQEPL